MKGIVIVPAYNEEKTIGWVVDKIKEIGMDVLVIDDGSTDKTFRRAQKAGARVIRHNKNKGKGEALKTAFIFSSAHYNKIDYVVIIDADMQYHPSEIPYLVNALKDADYVIGQRDWSQVPFRHRLGNWVWIKIFNWKHGTSFKDISCGFISMKKNVYSRLNVSRGYIVESDMIIQALRMGVKIKNVPVRVRYDRTRGILSGIGVVLGVMIFMIKKRGD